MSDGQSEALHQAAADIHREFRDFMVKTATAQPALLDTLQKAPGYWYLATPYTCYPEGRELAFIHACQLTAYLIEHDVAVYSPIAHTHPIATHGHLDPVDGELWKQVDQPMVDAANGLIVAELDGWDNSVGVGHEIEAFSERPIVHWEPQDMPPLAATAKQETILEEAARLTARERNADYGHPADDFERTAAIWSALLGTDVTPRDVALCMIGVKLSRESHRPKRDNRVDICGYAQCIEMIAERQPPRSYPI